MQVTANKLNSLPTMKSSGAPKAAPQEQAPAGPADSVASSPAPSKLPSLADIKARAEASEPSPEASAEGQLKTGLSTGKKAALIGLAGVAALTATAGSAQAADLDVTIGPGGINIHIGKGHHRGRRHGRYGHDRDGSYLCQPHNHTDGPYWEGWGLDGQWHRFDRHNEVNDETGHYRFVTDAYGNVTGVDCNVRHDGWGY